MEQDFVGTIPNSTPDREPIVLDKQVGSGSPLSLKGNDEAEMCRNVCFQFYDEKELSEKRGSD